MRGFGAFDDCPSASFLFAGGEITYKSEKFVGRFDKAIETAFGEAVVLHKHCAIFVAEVAQILFELGAKHDCFGVFILCDTFDFLCVRIAVYAGFVRVCDVNDGLGREQKLLVHKAFEVLVHIEIAERFAAFKPLLHHDEAVDVLLILFVGFDLDLCGSHAAFKRFHIRKISS